MGLGRGPQSLCFVRLFPRKLVIYASEIAQSMKQTIDARECAKCGLIGHLSDARYCRRCAEKLD